MKNDRNNWEINRDNEILLFENGNFSHMFNMNIALIKIANHARFKIYMDKL